MSFLSHKIELFEKTPISAASPNFDNEILEENFLISFETFLLKNLEDLIEIVDLTVLNKFINNLENITSSHNLTLFNKHIETLKSSCDIYDFEQITSTLKNILYLYNKSKPNIKGNK